jgi:ABC-type Fe3+ transport system permease subunit
VLSEVSWAFQSLISVVSFYTSNKLTLFQYFVIYWQFGHFQDVFSIKTWAAFNLKTSEHIHRKTWKTYTMFSIFAIFTVLMGTFVAFAYYSDNMKTYDMDKNLYEGMGPGTGILSVIISIFHGIVWTLVFMFYVLVLSILSQVLEAFNNEVKKVSLV